MAVTQILLLILVLILFGILPIWPHSKKWGRLPSGIVGLLILVLIILMFFNV